MAAPKPMVHRWLPYSPNWLTPSYLSRFCCVFAVPPSLPVGRTATWAPLDALGHDGFHLGGAAAPERRSLIEFRRREAGAALFPNRKHDHDETAEYEPAP